MSSKIIPSPVSRQTQLLLVTINEPSGRASTILGHLILLLRHDLVAVLGNQETTNLTNRAISHLPRGLHLFRDLPRQLRVPQPETNQVAACLGVSVGVALVEQSKVIDEENIARLRRNGDGVLLCDLGQDLKGLNLRLIQVAAVVADASGGGVETEATRVDADDAAALVVGEDGDAGKAGGLRGQLYGPVGGHELLEHLGVVGGELGADGRCGGDGCGSALLCDPAVLQGEDLAAHVVVKGEGSVGVDAVTLLLGNLP